MTTTWTPSPSTALVVAFDKMPDNVMSDINLIGGWFLGIVNVLAIVHLVFLAGAIAFERMGHHSPVTAGQWFTKVVAGVWIAAVAGDIAAVVIFTA